MAYLAKMAWRNLGRHSGRTALSLLAIAMGVFVVVVAKGVIDGMIDSWITYNITLNSGHLRIIRPEYRLKEQLLSLGYLIGSEEASYDSIVTDMRRIPDVAVASGRVRFGMLLTAGGGVQETVLGIATELDEEEKVVRLSRFLQGSKAGRLPNAGQREILLGNDLMAKLGVGVGDKVTAVFSTSFGSLGIATFQAVGSMSSGLKFLDESVAYVPLDVAMDLLDMEGSVTEIVVFARDSRKTQVIKAEAERALGAFSGAFEVIPWNEHNELIAGLSLAKGIYTVIYVLLLTLACFVVFNTLLMVVSERTYEIGMLAALGLAPASIQRLFLIEGAILAVAGSLVGAAMGGLFNSWFSRAGIDISKMAEGLGGDILITARLYPKADIAVLVSSFLLGVAVSMVAVYIPARNAGSLKPTEALRTT